MRFDFVFSYWIFAWYLFYVLKLTSYKPKIALIIGIIHNSILLLSMIYYKNDWIHILTFCFINLCIKVIPLWTIRHEEYRWKDAYALLIYFIIYLIWLYLNNQIKSISLQKSIQRLKNNMPAGPFTYYVDKYLRS
jgi:hypothetical protein